MKTIKKLVVFNNPCFNCVYFSEIDLETAKVLYRTNMTESRNDYTCFFLVPKDRLEDFQRKVVFLQEWQTSFIRKEGIYLDGYRWSIKLVDDIEKEIIGEQSKPEEFDCFIIELEKLLQKDFGVHPLLCAHGSTVQYAPYLLSSVRIHI